MKEWIAKVAAGEHLSADEIAIAFGAIMDGEATPAQIGALLMALRMKGETPDEIAGAARAMRARATPLAHPDHARGVDTCGTGGDGSGSFNVSTLAAIVVAAMGGVVAKHGNRALSSRSGSADVLEALGVTIDGGPALVERCMQAAGIGFAFAPTFHAATRHVAGPRKELGTRTIFNLLGPLTNPAQVKHQVVGVFSEKWCAPVAHALGVLGARRAFVVHGAGGIDEIAVAGPTFVAEWDGTMVRTSIMTPAAFGFGEADPAGLAGGDALHNASLLRSALAGRAHPAIVIAASMEAALAIVALGMATDLREAAAEAARTLADGRAATVLARWVEACK